MAAEGYRLMVVGVRPADQLTDVEQEINGLMTYDRKPKFDAKRLRGINALVP